MADEPRKTEEMIKYGVRVTADVELESIRADGCLCFRCKRLVTRKDVEHLIEPIQNFSVGIYGGLPEIQDREEHLERLKAMYNCPIAQRIYEVCIDGDVAAPVTRCPMFAEK